MSRWSIDWLHCNGPQMADDTQPELLVEFKGIGSHCPTMVCPWCQTEVEFGYFYGGPYDPACRVFECENCNAVAVLARSVEGLDADQSIALVPISSVMKTVEDELDDCRDYDYAEVMHVGGYNARSAIDVVVSSGMNYSGLLLQGSNVPIFWHAQPNE